MTKTDIEERFVGMAQIDKDHILKLESFNRKFRDLALDVLKNVQPCQQKDEAIIKLEESCMWLGRAILKESH